MRNSKSIPEFSIGTAPVSRIEDDLQQSNWRNDYSKTGMNIICTGIWMKSQHSDLLKKFCLSHSQYNILCILQTQQQAPIGVNQIQKRMIDKHSNVSRIAEKLLKKNYIEMRPCGSDRRSVHLFITRSGLSLLSLIEAEVSRTSGLLRHLSSGELEMLNILLDKVRAIQLSDPN